MKIRIEKLELELDLPSVLTHWAELESRIDREHQSYVSRIVGAFLPVAQTLINDIFAKKVERGEPGHGGGNDEGGEGGEGGEPGQDDEPPPGAGG